MNRVELIAAEVEKAREAARRKADEVGLKLSSEYSVKGLGRSGALLKALLDTDLAAVETVLMTRVDSEDRYPPKALRKS